MKRAEKYPNTSTFTFYNANPKGKYTSDCVARALSTALNIPYNNVVLDLAHLQCSTGYDKGDVKLYEIYLKSKGYEKHKQPRKEDNTKYTGVEFCQVLADKGKKYVVHIGGNHIAAIINGKVFDTWNSTDGCIGNYWVIE